jgi:hypothetical protein
MIEADTSCAEDEFSDGMGRLQTLIHILQHLSRDHNPIPGHIVAFLADQMEEERGCVGHAVRGVTWSAGR